MDLILEVILDRFKFKRGTIIAWAIFICISGIMLIGRYKENVALREAFWGSALERAIKYRTSGDCTKAWEILWKHRHSKGSYSYLALAVMAKNGITLSLQSTEYKNFKLSYKLALLAANRGNLLKPDEILLIPKTNGERAGLEFLIWQSVNILNQYLPDDGNKRIKTCNLPSCLETKISSIDKFVVANKQKISLFETEVGKLISSKAIHIQCINIGN